MSLTNRSEACSCSVEGRGIGGQLQVNCHDVRLLSSIKCRKVVLLCCVQALSSWSALNLDIGDQLVVIYFTNE